MKPLTWYEWLLLAAAMTLAVGIFIHLFKLWRWVPGIPRNIGDLIKWLWRLLRPLIVLLVGMTLVLGGLAMVPLPGPGVPLLLIGLAILGTEFLWARVLLVKMQSTASSVGNFTGFTALSLPPDAGPAKRITFFIGSNARAIAARLGLTRLTNWLNSKLQINPNNPPP